MCCSDAENLRKAQTFFQMVVQSRVGASGARPCAERRSALRACCGFAALWFIFLVAANSRVVYFQNEGDYREPIQRVKS
jgi:hypothetical protein